LAKHRTHSIKFKRQVAREFLAGEMTASFPYGDSYRLGVNFNQIPVNAPKCPFHSYHRDGAMRTDGNLGRTPTYFPNSRGEWTDQPDLNEPPLDIEGAAPHWDSALTTTIISSRATCSGR
jgi:catalase